MVTPSLTILVRVTAKTLVCREKTWRAKLRPPRLGDEAGQSDAREHARHEDERAFGEQRERDDGGARAKSGKPPADAEQDIDAPVDLRRVLDEEAAPIRRQARHDLEMFEKEGEISSLRARIREEKTLDLLKANARMEFE